MALGVPIIGRRSDASIHAALAKELATQESLTNNALVVVPVGVRDDHDELARQVLVGELPKLRRFPERHTRHVKDGRLGVRRDDRGQYGVGFGRTLDEEVDECGIGQSRTGVRMKVDPIRYMLPSRCNPVLVALVRLDLESSMVPAKVVAKLALALRPIERRIFGMHMPAI